MNLCFANREMLFFKKNLIKCSGYCIYSTHTGGKNAIIACVSKKKIKRDEGRSKERLMHRSGLGSPKGPPPLHFAAVFLRDNGT